MEYKLRDIYIFASHIHFLLPRTSRSKRIKGSKERFFIFIFYSLPPFSPSQINLMISVDVKHHVYLTYYLFRQDTTCNCGFLHCLPKFDGLKLKCDDAYASLHGVFADGSRLHHPRVQFAANVTKPVSDRIKEGGK